MSEKKFEYKEPLKGERFIFTLLPLDSLEVISHQRKPSQYHVKHLLQSLRKIGFTVPIMVVEGDKKGKYVIIDGQHRFLAAKELELEKIPAIIVPKKMAKLMMNFNIEKELNIREKSYVALQVYEEILQKEPEMAENDPEIIDAIEQGYYVTLGIAYKNTEKLAGSSFESILKKCDLFLDLPLKEAFRERNKRAEKILEANQILKDIVQKAKEMGKFHPFLYNQILSYANPHKRERDIFDFNETFDQIIETLREIEENPEFILEREE
ncbi:MAG: ParB/RepB/Spo0J family partition protein [Candidatus Desulfofervidus auxilii]|nr:ParB/RepB/Spo0J family partition protein [Candidatus Desulfofervidus auxilii]